MSTHPEAFILLHIPDVTLSTANASETGTLALECVTLAPDSTDQNAPLAASLSASDRSLILVLRLGSLELPLDPARAISLHISPDGTRTYTFHSDAGAGGGLSPADREPGFIRLTVPVPSRPDTHRAESVEALDHILGQYANFDWHAESGGAPHEQQQQPESTQSIPPEDLRGKLVLMDEQSGEVVGELPNRVNIKEDPALAQGDGKGKDGQPAPVMLELPPDMYDAYTGAGTSVVPFRDQSSDLDEAREIFVHAIPPEDQDWMTKSATLISSAISTSTSMLLTGLTHATNYYINHSAPAPPPGQATKDGTPPPPPPRALLLLSHPRTTQTLSRAYAISGQAAKVSSRTVGIVEDLIKRAVGAAPSADKGKKPATALAAAPSAPPGPYASASASTASVRSVQSEAPPPPYPGTATPGQDGKPPLPPRRGTAPATGAPAPGPAPPLPPRSVPGTPSSVPGTPAPAPLGPGAPKPLGRGKKLALSANLIVATVDDSLRRTFDVGAERVSAVVGHKYGADAGRSTHLAAHTARNVTLVYIDMRGFARRALIKKAGRHWIKAKIGPLGGPGGAGAGAGGREMSGMVVDRQEQGASEKK